MTGRLSSDSLGTGTLELTAAINDVAPVTVSGRFNPLSAKEGSDLAVSITGWELIPVGPYSGRYLGYLIAKGKMKVEMQYRVVGRELRAENKLTIDQFTFGDATNSPEATTMPVKLGIAVMRDRDGQIVFDVPVEGNLDDPNFRLGRVIGRAILNVLTKLITSPFKLLGGLFGGGDADLSFVEFAPGSAALAPAPRRRNSMCSRSRCTQRPALKLEIAGAVDTLADAAALRAAKLDARLRTMMWTAQKAKDPNTPPPDSLVLTATDSPPLAHRGLRGRVPEGQRGDRRAKGEVIAAAASARGNGAPVARDREHHAGRPSAARRGAGEGVPRLHPRRARPEDRARIASSSPRAR